MNITKDMVQAATMKAVEAGLLPRRAYAEDIATNAEIMHDILQAALESVLNGDKDSSGQTSLPS